MKIIVAMLISLFPFQSLAAVPIEILSTADDTTGRQLVYEVKERIRSSSSLDLSFDSSKARVQARIVTMNPFPNNPDGGAVYSMVLTLKIPGNPLPYYIKQYTGLCGSTYVGSCAASITAEISNQSDEMIRLDLISDNR